MAIDPGYNIRAVPDLILIIQMEQDVQELLRVCRNNISYANEDGNVTVQSGALYTHDHNSWDIYRQLQ